MIDKDYRAMQIARVDLQHDANRINCARWKAEAERDALKQDAARYRWLRDADHERIIFAAHYERSSAASSKIDAAIDATREKL